MFKVLSSASSSSSLPPYRATFHKAFSRQVQVQPNPHYILTMSDGSNYTGQSKCSVAANDVIQPREIPTIITPEPSTDSEPIVVQYARSLSTSRSPDATRAASPDRQSADRGRSLSIHRASLTDFDDRAPSTPAPAPGESRWREVLWKARLWNKKAKSPGPHVRAVSQSASAPHPSVAEERMDNMPYTDWRA